jgi:sugar O-acyltransferase (sialic acid O-acetyltransferase NeuD family)
MDSLGESKDVYAAIGDGFLRQRLVSLVSSNNNFPVLIHPQTVIGPDCSFGEGVQIQQFSSIQPNVCIGPFTLVNVQVGIGHDCQIGEYVTLSPRVYLCGGVKLGDFVSIGTGAIVLPKVSICDNAVIGAGALVTKAITEPGTYIGTPAKRVK